uniref:Uncharacterized protein n=1 Tax=Timema poppense TaxID=170557 RepID=A0A7R9DLH0_TIMPO|nr:unnamed protein product [Timema poppensis]
MPNSRMWAALTNTSCKSHLEERVRRIKTKQLFDFTQKLGMELLTFRVSISCENGPRSLKTRRLLSSDVHDCFEDPPYECSRDCQLYSPSVSLRRATAQPQDSRAPLVYVYESGSRKRKMALPKGDCFRPRDMPESYSGLSRMRRLVFDSWSSVLNVDFPRVFPNLPSTQMQIHFLLVPTFLFLTLFNVSMLIARTGDKRKKDIWWGDDLERSRPQHEVSPIILGGGGLDEESKSTAPPLPASAQRRQAGRTGCCEVLVRRILLLTAET